ncbi:MAG: bifunctional (p)ppGpp synthetase/guanosine-3',5'-bis(diphosphate) 3'-pyrophosphohydrolase [Bacteroidaceae bacterium]|nr:bifunctional (p)ppGpp synthetase/guanosine-3',5'-bis(diphosphate) 3'-pyrophosphohydrolase [Bacteroidaceae bacterium]MBR1542390.1 bifunctional (p)ppGpp synthetase/guanosine-3',5'-bis(diphosphate) 3'-pyrophosphohydrolase [Bacteroidaceae bacterium]
MQYENEEEMIQQAFQELLNDYMATKHRKRVEIITKAFNFANQAHKGIRRLSGEPYIMHPLSVAKIVCNEIGLGSTSICSALLHDVVEDTDYTVEDIENIFGPKIAQIVDGLTKISGGIFGEHASAQAENFKKLLLTMNDDIRVILIKIADRLHNMRTLESQAPNKQYKIAGETLYLYAPLAYRLGLNKIKTELENLSFKYEHPEEYRDIEIKLQETATERDKVFTEFTAPIRQQLDKMGLKYRIMARVKAVYSIWNKMQTKHVPFDEVYDILAVRIIFEPISLDEEMNNCFDIYVAISKIYKPHPDRIRDWVSHPKANGYQALHVTLMANNGQWIEVQIRSERMNDIAEQGFAAHWKYKDGANISEDDNELNKWLETIKDILDDPQPDAMDFLDTIKLNLFAQEIFVFTPKGEIKTLPQNSTVLDFAFSLHTEIGRHCIGAKVNHKLVPLSHKLQSGDQVEVLTSRSQRVSPEWENIAATAKARTKIASILRKEAKNRQAKGLDILTEFLKGEEIYVDEIVLNKLTRLHEKPNHDAFLEAIGSGSIELGDADLNILRGKNSSSWRRFLKLPFGNKDNKTDNETSPKQEQPEKINTKQITKQILKLNEDNIQNKYAIADCCHPIPGDDVLGYIDTNGRITIHKRQCPIATKLKSSYGNRIIATQWDTHKQLTFLVTINIKGVDRLGLLNDVTQVISRQLSVNIRKVTIETVEGIFEGHIQLYVHDVDDVHAIIAQLKQIDSIQEVVRE